MCDIKPLITFFDNQMKQNWHISYSVLILKNKIKLEKKKIKIYNEITYSETLGITFDCMLKFSNHIAGICKKVPWKLNDISWIVP